MGRSRARALWAGTTPNYWIDHYARAHRNFAAVASNDDARNLMPRLQGQRCPTLRKVRHRTIEQVEVGPTQTHVRRRDHDVTRGEDGLRSVDDRNGVRSRDDRRPHGHAITETS